MAKPVGTPSSTPWLSSLSTGPPGLSHSLHLLGGCLPEVSNLLTSLGHTGRRIVVLGCTLNTLWRVITKKSHNVLSKFTILCWAAFTAILGWCGSWATGWSPLLCWQALIGSHSSCYVLTQLLTTVQSNWAGRPGWGKMKDAWLFWIAIRFSTPDAGFAAFTMASLRVADVSCDLLIIKLYLSY